MTPVPPLRSRTTVQDHTTAANPPVGVAMLTRRGVFAEGTTQRLATRSSVSMSHSNVILASVFGSVGFVALVALLILLVRYWMRRDTSEDMIIERPSHTFQDTPDSFVYQNAAPTQKKSASIAPTALDKPDPAYIPNHPYALYYTRDSHNTLPSTPSPKTSTHPQTQQPPLPSLSISHPYTQSLQPRRRERVPSADPSTIYESFMSDNSPIPTPELIIEPMEPSPLASTAGGAMSHHGSQFDALLSPGLSDEAPSSMSVSSSVPLRPGEKQPRR